MGGVNLSINKMEFSLAISQLLLVQLGKFVDTIIFEIVEHYCMFITLVRLGKQRKVDFSTDHGVCKQNFALCSKLVSPTWWGFRET